MTAKSISQISSCNSATAKGMVTTPLSIYDVKKRSTNELIATLSILQQWGTDDDAKPHATPKDELADHLNILEYIIEENKEVLAEFYAAFHELEVNVFDLEFKLIEILNLPTSDARAGDLNLSGYPQNGFIWSIDLYNQITQ